MRSRAHAVLSSIAIALSILGGADQAAAQNRLGFFGGVNLATMGGDIERIGDELAAELEEGLGGDWTADTGATTGAGFGASYLMTVTPTVGVQLEGQWIRRGMVFDVATEGLDVETAFELGYFEVPLLLRFSPGSAGSLRFVALAGPVFGFRTGAKMVISAAGQEESGEVDELFKPKTFGALGAIGLTVATGPRSAILLQARYYRGLTSAFDDEDTYSGHSTDLGFFAGIELNAGRE